jgi:methylenetetrahydrofolate dehydrogenase (NADP+)/methenyltetrahydrofolate cyclohydrolase
MSAEIIKGKTIANDIEQKIHQEVKTLKQKGVQPKLGVIYIGNHKPSETYIKQKESRAKELGIEFELFDFEHRVKSKTVKKEIRKIQENKSLDGLIIQLPIPDKLYPELLDEVKPQIDVDCLTSKNLGKLVKKSFTFLPPTAGAILEVLDKINVEYKGKKITVVGTGMLVGKPLANLLINKEATLTTCNKHTKNLAKECKQADIIISGVGQKYLITKNMVTEDTIVIDTGIDYVEGKMFGDVDFEQVKQKASYITPTPGGIGPITVAKLFENVVLSAKISNQT